MNQIKLKIEKQMLKEVCINLVGTKDFFKLKNGKDMLQRKIIC